LPEGVLGLTRFGPNGVEDIMVAKALDDDGTGVAERRIVTTLAHEAGHGLFHTYYFALGTDGRSLFGESASNEPLILCRDEKPVASYRGQWWEYQANKAMAALLLPSQLVTAALESYLLRIGSFGAIALDQERRPDAIKMLSETFNVNPVVARLRLDSLYSETAQLTL
jgi:Zn-dependent peptidase ImmA (M78 family)